MSEAYAATRSYRLDRALQELLAQTSEIEAATVVSFDGLPMASALPASMDEDRVAAMSAALLSLGERAAQGLGRGDLSQVYIEGDTGTVFLVSAEDEAVLVAVAAKGAKAGLMLYEVRRAAAVVAAVLQAADEPPRAATTVPVAPAPGTPLVAVPAQETASSTAPTAPEPARNGWAGPTLVAGSVMPSPPARPTWP
jgi:predicted regulator of Ras-like GTPase activity (Roadblock/LC7/MglB family)